MSDGRERTMRVSSIFVCAIGLGVAAWTGCEKPSEDASSSAEQPTPAESTSGPGGDRTKPSAGDDEPGSPGNPSPSAGTDEPDEEPGSAGDPPPSPEGAQAGESNNDITDEELRKFLEVTEKLQPKKEGLKQALDEAETPSEAKKAQKEVMKETRKAAEEVGLEFDRFRTISREVKNDASLKRRLSDLAAEKEAGGE